LKGLKARVPVDGVHGMRGGGWEARSRWVCVRAHRVGLGDVGGEVSLRMVVDRR
jgi:hypothetical protein